MRQYDEIYTQPDENQEPLGSNYALYSNDGDGDGCYLDDLHLTRGPVIVLTVEEAEAIWNAGMRAQALQHNQKAKWIDFKILDGTQRCYSNR